VNRGPRSWATGGGERGEKAVTRAEIEKAIVTVTKKGGQGVLVSGNLIVTAAHCVDFSCEGEMVLGEWYIEEIETTLGRLKVCPLAIGPVSDIAVLGALDGQEFPDEQEKFEQFCWLVKPVSICTKDPELQENMLYDEFPVYVHTHKRVWIEAKARLWGLQRNMVWIDTDQQIEGGTSGGPVVNAAGELVGVISNASTITEALPKSTGRIPRPHLTLPVWVWQQISTADEFDEVVGVMTGGEKVVCAGCVKDWNDFNFRFHDEELPDSYIFQSETGDRGKVFTCSRCGKRL
jgi:hypothetical protein